MTRTYDIVGVERDTGSSLEWRCHACVLPLVFCQRKNFCNYNYSVSLSKYFVSFVEFQLHSHYFKFFYLCLFIFQRKNSTFFGEISMNFLENGSNFRWNFLSMSLVLGLSVAFLESLAVRTTQELWWLVIIHTIICGALLVITIFTFPNAPPTPPTASAALQSHHEGIFIELSMTFLWNFSEISMINDMGSFCW